ncbi:MAG: glutathione S-transferase [Cystobacter sp.]
MKVYQHPLSGHCHRVVLFLSLLGLEAELIEVDAVNGGTRTPGFLKLNRFGQVPVLVDGDAVITDSNAILVYLARKARRSDWLPDTPMGEASVQKWLSVAAGELAYGPAAARIMRLFGGKGHPDEAIARAHELFKLLDAELTERKWLAAPHPTLAEVALYGYTARAPEGLVSLADYPHVNDWLRRIEALPGFVELRRSP